MDRWRTVRRGAQLLATISVVLVLSAGPAAAKWFGTLGRDPTNPSGPSLELVLNDTGSSFGMHFGLDLPGYTISNVSSTQPGPLGTNACTATPNSDLTTGNAGIDCTFGAAVTGVSVTFTTTPRYPDSGNGVAYDDQDSKSTPVIGPSPSPPPPVASPARSLDKKIARFVLGDSWATYVCNQLNPTGGIMAFDAYGLGRVALSEILSDREDCYPRLTGRYQALTANQDPPDANVLAVALPDVQASQAPRSCPRSATHKGRQICAALRRLLEQHDRATARYVAVWGAIVTTLNRLSTALANADPNGTETQNAALTADSGELLQASTGLDGVDAALAHKLTALHASPSYTHKDGTAGWKAVEAAKLPPGVLARLEREGISRAALHAASASLPKPRGKLTLLSLLRRPAVPPASAAALAADVKTLSPDDLSALANGLQTAGAIDQGLAQTLVGDANAIKSATSPSARAAAVNKAVADAGQAPGEAGTLLVTAARALAA